MLTFILTICGLVAVVTGRLPAAVMGGKQYRVTGAGARLVGTILMLAYPIFWVLGLVLARLPAEQARDYALLLQLLGTVSVLVAASIAGRLVRKPVVAA